MAKATKGRGKIGKRATRRRTPARKAKRAARAGTTKARTTDAAASKRIAVLEAENRRLREEIASLRGDRESRPAREGSEGPPALEL